MIIIDSIPLITESKALAGDLIVTYPQSKKKDIFNTMTSFLWKKYPK